MRRAFRLPFLIFFLFPFFLGTTFIIKENGAEVGRYDESDGKSETKIIDNDASRVVDAGKPAPKETRVWTVQGRVRDLWRNKDVAGGEIEFTSDAPVRIKVEWNGNFTGKLPVLPDGKKYGIFYRQEGYGRDVFLFRSGETEKLNEYGRVSLMTAVPTLAMVGDSAHDLEIGVRPIHLTPEEKKAFQAASKKIESQKK